MQILTFTTDEINALLAVCEEGPGICSHLLTLISLLLILITLPFSLCCVVQVVQVITGFSILFDPL